MKKLAEPMVTITFRVKQSTLRNAQRMHNAHKILPGTFSEYLREVLQDYFDRKR